MILFGMPVAQVFLFGYAITNEVKDAEIAIWDQSQDHMSKKLTAKVIASEYFSLSAVVHSHSELSDGFQQGDYKIAMVIPPKFASRFSSNESKVQLLMDASDPNIANILSNYGTAIIQTFMFKESGFRSPQVIVSEVRMTYNPELKGVFLFVPGVITIILMLVSTLLTSIALTRESELGTMEILLVSPLKPATIVLGKVIPYLLLSFVNALIILVLGVAVFGMPVLGSPVLLLLEFILFILSALSIGIFISTKTGSQQVAMMISLFGLMMPTILLSGFIFPIASMPLPLQILSNVMPAKFFIIIVKGIMLQGVGIDVLWKPTLAILGFTVLFTALSIKNFKIRLA